MDDYIASLASPPRDYDLRGKLLHFQQFGFAVFPKAAPEALIDCYLQDVQEILARRELSTEVVLPGPRITTVKDCPPELIDAPQVKLNDFHNPSLAGKKLALNAQIVSFLSHVFRETPVAMQTLTFQRGSEQGVHQDYAYVVAQTPSHLAASWLALEDIHPDSGPLRYFPGSHTIRKFDWGNGLYLTAESTRNPAEFERHILDEVERMGLKETVFCPRKGDIFVWHAALAHGGTPLRNPKLTRKSLVTHFSSESGYRWDRRWSGEEPIRHRYNGGVIFTDKRHLAEEDVMTRGAAF